MQRRHWLGHLAALSATWALPMAHAQTSPFPCFVLCLPGDAGWLEKLDGLVRQHGAGFRFDAEHSQRQPHPQLVRSFERSADILSPSLQAQDLDALRGHQSVGYVLSPVVTAANGVAVARQALTLGAQLMQAGALGLKSESAGLAHGRARWLALADALKAAKPEAAHATLLKAWVRRPIGSQLMRYTVGMHTLGQPELEDYGGGSDLESLARMDAAASALLAGASVAGARVPDRHHHPQSPDFNPHGLIRLGMAS